MKITSFQAANFTGYVGERFRFQTLDDNGEAMGPVLDGFPATVTHPAGRTFPLQRGHKECGKQYYPPMVKMNRQRSET